MDIDREQIDVGHIRMHIQDVAGSVVRSSVKHDLWRDTYGLTKVPFSPGDVVVDIGANIGMVSIYLALREPRIKIYAYEPVPENFRNLTQNLLLNDVKNVKALNFAVGAQRGTLPMIAHMKSNTGGATSYLHNMHLPEHQNFLVRVATLNDVFETHPILRCRLLKIDAEGAEYDILYNFSYWDRLEYLSGEFHQNELLEGRNFSPEGLATYCASKLDKSKMTVTVQQMAN